MQVVPLILPTDPSGRTLEGYLLPNEASRSCCVTLPLLSHSFCISPDPIQYWQTSLHLQIQGTEEQPAGLWLRLSDIPLAGPTLSGCKLELGLPLAQLLRVILVLAQAFCILLHRNSCDAHSMLAMATTAVYLNNMHLRCNITQ